MAHEMDMKVKIKGVEIINFELIQPSIVLSHEVVYNFNLTIEHTINPHDKLIFVLVGINISHGSNENILGKILINCQF